MYPNIFISNKFWGLFEEYRNEIKIGEVRRELQLEVLICPPRFKPMVTTEVVLSGSISLSFLAEQENQEECLVLG